MPDRKLRIIPAYAGSTSHYAGQSGATGDHPRIRGEHLRDRWAKDLSTGSSPHTRGAPSSAPDLGREGGIIPAYAGSTLMTPPSTGLSLDHPRIRGEHAGDDDATTELKGSSPHTRGALLPVSRGGSDSRIIPAYAGSTEYARSVPLSVPDHPRIRGEHSNAALYGRSWSGSSPHTRGARFSLGCDGSSVGIIPAYAGSTFEDRQSYV